MSRRRHVVVATNDPVTDRMPGPAIRAWHMAEALSAEHDVDLVTTAACDRAASSFRVRHTEPDDLRSLEAEWDVLVMQGGLLRTHPFLIGSSKPIVVDLYDPFHLENLEQTRGLPMAEREEIVSHLTGVLNEQVARGDFFLCASTRQRNFWLGSLTAVGRVNPHTLRHDPALESLLAIVPFGLPPEPPRHGQPALHGVVDGIEVGDRVILWAGGVYNWFDPLTLVRAVDRLRHRLPRVRLFFLGMAHPNPAIPHMQVATELRTLADELGLTGRSVFFNDGWVDYDRRADYLLEADIGVSTHHDHVETAYSFRTRILDYLWAGLPVVATAGDAFGELIEAESLGAAVPPGDVDALETALYVLLTEPERLQACRAAVTRVAPRFVWSSALEPLLRFCREPARAPDAAVRPEASRTTAR